MTQLAELTLVGMDKVVRLGHDAAGKPTLLNSVPHRSHFTPQYGRPQHIHGPTER